MNISVDTEVEDQVVYFTINHPDASQHQMYVSFLTPTDGTMAHATVNSNWWENGTATYGELFWRAFSEACQDYLDYLFRIETNRVYFAGRGI